MKLLYDNIVRITIICACWQFGQALAQPAYQQKCNRCLQACLSILDQDACAKTCRRQCASHAQIKCAQDCETALFRCVQHNIINKQRCYPDFKRCEANCFEGAAEHH